MDGQNIDFSARKESSDYEKLRQQLIVELEGLIWQDMDAIHQLEDYCLNRRNTIDNRVKSLLIKKGIIAEDGTLPDLTNEAMYELRTGQKPFWLNDNRL
jgi:hypothetical protein